VAREVESFLTTHQADRLLVVLTGGAITWDTVAGDFDWALTTALPDCLRGRFHDQPLYVDLSSQSPSARMAAGCSPRRKRSSSIGRSTAVPRAHNDFRDTASRLPRGVRV